MILISPLSSVFTDRSNLKDEQLSFCLTAELDLLVAVVVNAETEQSSPALVDQLVSMTKDKIMLAELTEPSPADQGPSPGGEAVRREVVLWPAGASRPAACNWETSLNRAIIGRDIVLDGESGQVFL